MRTCLRFQRHLSTLAILLFRRRRPLLPARPLFRRLRRCSMSFPPRLRRLCRGEDCSSTSSGNARMRNARPHRVTHSQRLICRQRHTSRESTVKRSRCTSMRRRAARNRSLGRTSWCKFRKGKPAHHRRLRRSLRESGCRCPVQSPQSRHKPRRGLQPWLRAPYLVSHRGACSCHQQ